MEAPPIYLDKITPYRERLADTCKKLGLPRPRFKTRKTEDQSKNEYYHQIIFDFNDAKIICDDENEAHRNQEILKMTEKNAAILLKVLSDAEDHRIRNNSRRSSGDQTLDIPRTPSPIRQLLPDCKQKSNSICTEKNMSSSPSNNSLITQKTTSFEINSNYSFINSGFEHQLNESQQTVDNMISNIKMEYNPSDISESNKFEPPIISSILPKSDLCSTGDHVSWLNLYSQKNNYPKALFREDLQSTGPGLFSYRCQFLNWNEFGCGNSKKEAKKDSALKIKNNIYKILNMKLEIDKTDTSSFSVKSECSIPDPLSAKMEALSVASSPNSISQVNTFYQKYKKGGHKYGVAKNISESTKEPLFTVDVTYWLNENSEEKTETITSDPCSSKRLAKNNVAAKLAAIIKSRAQFESFG